MSETSEIDDHVVLNRASWDVEAAKYEEPGRRAWGLEAPTWGIWHVAETELKLLPPLRGLDAVELGCGTAYVSAWLARLGARPVGIDNSMMQLSNARKFQREFGLEFPLIHCNAEAVPLASGSFDFAISEYGACLWCDPYRWIPEAARLLRPGGRLVFLTNSAFLMVTMPDLEADFPVTDRMIRDYFGMHRFDWPDDPGIEFHLNHGDWIRVLGAHGLEVEDLVEIRPPEGSTSSYPFATLEWARRWPTEEVWKAVKR